jgi:hypothetical protein
MHRDAPQPEWLDLKALSSYACVSEKTLRAWIHSVTNPLPAYQRGTKIYVRKSEFDRWLQRHAVTDGASLDRIVDEIVASFRE